MRLRGLADCSRVDRFEFRTRRDISLRQIKRECAASAETALEPDFAAEQSSQLAADRQAETGSTVLTARRAVGLLKRLKDDALFFLGDADTGVRNRERNHVLGAVEYRMGGAPARGYMLDAQLHGTV